MDSAKRPPCDNEGAPPRATPNQKPRNPGIHSPASSEDDDFLDRPPTPWAPKKPKVASSTGVTHLSATRVDVVGGSSAGGPNLTFLQRLLAAKDKGPREEGIPGPHYPGLRHPPRDEAHPAAPGLAPRPETPSSPTPAARYTAPGGARLRDPTAKGMNPFTDRIRGGPSPQQPHQQQQQPQHQQQQQQQQQFQQQHAPHPSAHGQNFVAMNGMNGGAPGGMGGMPTPAGHQSELNYIYSLVEELSKQLADNRRQTEEIVSGIGRVRNRARNQALGNEELISAASEEINGQEKNLDSLVSVLSEALEKAKHSRDANAALLQEYARSMGTMLRQVHDYKANQVEEISRWHHSYRGQLAAEREENCRLREQIWEMQRRAGKANEALREFRSQYEESEERWARRVDSIAARQEVRFWKRMAMPEIPDDDPYWSDDDDLIDVKEKMRIREEQRAAREQREQQELLAQNHEEADDHNQVLPTAQGPQARAAPGGFGSVAMQRDESTSALSLPLRSGSAASTGSSGQ